MTGDGPEWLRHNPTLVQGYRFNGANAEAIATWVRANGGEAWFVEGELVVATPDGHHTTLVGDTVIHGTQHEHYQIRPPVRAACYETVETT